MKRATLSTTLLVAGLPLLAAAAPAADAPALRRFALVASSNDGGPSRTPLRFANSDGESFGRVLGSLGGVREGDLILIRDSSRADLQRAFADLRARLGRESRPQVRREVFVYFSGHSDEEGLLLGGQRVSYRELRQWIDATGADVRIAILDSCASGSLIRLKGGVHRAPFLRDLSTKARGHAFLTASSADEAAQESDRIGAAFFTHYLLSGLRGAADANRDRRVTLGEAYQFAYNETLQRTETSRAGAQHPSYDFQLAGTGDVVLTDLRASASRLVLVRELAGRIYVRDAADRLVVELRKEPTYPIELGLDTGKYRVVLDRDGSISSGTFDLRSGERLEIASASLTAVAPLANVRRGDEPPPAAGPPPEVAPTVAATAAPPRRYRRVGFDLVLAPGFRMSGDTGEPVEHGFMLGLLGHSDSVRGVQLSVAGNIARDRVVGAQIGGMVALSYGPVRGAQVAGYNLAMGGLHGAQVGYFASVASGPARGAQVSMVNVANGQMRGAQIGLVSVEKGSLDGAQIGLVNVLRPQQATRGAQIGLANVTTGAAERSAASIGLVNVGRRQRGVQIGLVNVADEIDGAQIGLVSYARKNRGVSIGLFPVVLDGENHLTLGWTSTSAANLGFKLGTRWVYVNLSVGVTRDTDQNGDRYCAMTGGIGVHAIPRKRRFYLDIDATHTSFATFAHPHDAERMVSSLRLQVGYAIARRLAVVAGPTLNVATAWGEDDRRPRGVSFAERVWTSGETTVRMYPGLAAGLEF
ncbi:MAG: caspase family protein [Deltaproteobacteria bacterium]|nr:caspase family protein [Deltaproteobacteria bacterium]